MSPVTLLIVILLVVLLVGALPSWGWSRSWGAGYFPSGIVAVIFIIVVVLLLTNRL